MLIDSTIVWYFILSYMLGVAKVMVALFWIMFFMVRGGSKIIIEKKDT